MKANHNSSSNINLVIAVVYNVKDTIFESKSQRQTFYGKQNIVVYNVKDTIFESKSQHSDTDTDSTKVVYNVKDTIFESKSQL